MEKKNKAQRWSQLPQSQKGDDKMRHVLAKNRASPKTPDDKQASSGNKKSKKRSSWKGICRKIRLLLPYLWPKNNRILQLRVILSVFILISTRVVTVFVPIYQKKIVNSLTLPPPEQIASTDDTNKSDIVQYTTVIMSTNTVYATTSMVQGIQFRWDYILIYIVLRTLRSGYLSTFRSVLWVAVSQDTKRRMRLKLFSHLHNLSLQWHLQRKTGEVLRVMDRGVNSISTVLSHVVFNIIPVFADVIIGVVYFISAFNVWIGLIVFGAMVGYLVCTVVLTEWRTKYRRKMNETDNEKSAASVDSILNFETVKYYAAEEWEVNRYADVVDKHLYAERVFIVLSNMVSSVQQTIIGLGLLGGSLLCAWYVYVGHFTVGDYVLFASYVEYMYGPLGNFGNQYRLIQQSFIDMENMFDMLAEKDQIDDEPDAEPINVHKGEIEFRDVTFAYTPERTILQNINFKVPSGQTFALVGHTGCGKSTILRLLLRFYDTKIGSIVIDGQDITKVQQKSLRQKIGVVPQDTVLFNNTIRYNVRYGRVDADDTSVEQAASAANIHDKILSFPDGYNSKVGERGLKLSGGEKQRIAIARTVLKNPAIVLLDEATSALDTKTERTIQASLAEMCQNRTTIIVAHRLSTIVNADQILVLRDGQIIERGRHGELVELAGTYAEMWLEQQKEADNISNNSDRLSDVGTNAILDSRHEDENDGKSDDETPSKSASHTEPTEKLHNSPSADENECKQSGNDQGTGPTTDIGPKNDTNLEDSVIITIGEEPSETAKLLRKPSQNDNVHV